MKTLLGCVAVWVGFTIMAVAQPPAQDGFGAGGRTAYGQPGPGGPGDPPPNAMFSAIDADGDGAITARELRKAVVALKQLDADQDGKITRDEVLGGQPNPQAMIDRALENDKDGDGKLSKNELPRHLAQMLKGADANGDGSLDRGELGNAMETTRPQFGGPSGAGGPGGFNGARGFSGVEGFNGDPRPGGPNLSQYDRNGDGHLSVDEVPAQMRGMLRGTDRNGDGQLNAQELQAIQQRLNERVRGQRALPPGVSVGPQGVTGSPRKP